VYDAHQNLSRKQKTLLFKDSYNYDQKSAHPTLVSNASEAVKQAIASIRQVASGLFDSGVIDEVDMLKITKLSIIKIIAGASVKASERFTVFKSLGERVFNLVLPQLKLLKEGIKSLSKSLGITTNSVWCWLQKKEQEIQQVVIDYCDANGIFWLNEHDGIITNEPIDFSNFDLGVQYRLKPFS
jgi:hypothetical protein